MCGIAGLLFMNCAQDEGRALVAKSLSSIAHRGDSRFQSEMWCGELGVAGANRLPFTSGSTPQPALDQEGRYRLFLNGEIYSLHASKAANGKSDTQRLIECIAEGGIVKTLAEQEGMYAMLVVDTLEQCFYLARDVFGIKPLYYAITTKGVFIGSELKSLSIHSCIEEIKHVEAGSVLRIDAHGISELARISITPNLHAAGVDIATEIRYALSNSVREQTRDGHTYGIFLSGGLDSSAVYALARIHGARIRPLVLGTAAASDVAAATEVTRYYGDDLIVVDCPSEQLLFADIAETVRVCESFEPNVVRQSSVSRVLARAANQHGCDVALCGEGADELFGGYPEFWEPTVDFSKMRELFLRDLPRTQLQRVDRANMEHTIEVRVPFLCRKVAEIALGEPDFRCFGNRDGSVAKRPLRDAMRGILPDSIVDRPKVVLSEGAGLRGNNFATGMFSDFFAKGDMQPSNRSSIVERSTWGLGTMEEEYYFSAFKSFGYNKYIGAMNRVVANTTATLSC